MKGVVVEAEWNPREGYVPSPLETESGRAENGAQVWHLPEWSVKEMPDPEVREPDDVLLKIRRAGMCGSDVHMWETDSDGYIMLAYRTRFPVVLGHEFCGEVVEVGSGVTSLVPGDAVAVEEITWCGECRHCQRGLLNQCLNGEDYGLTLNGGFADYVVVKDRYCWSLNALRDRYGEEKVFTLGALTEPTSVAYEGLFRRAGGFEPGAHVAVWGCGPIGLAAVELARAAGAGKILAIETQAGRREIAARCGADLVLDPGEVTAAGSTIAAEIMQATGGDGLGMAIEASGAHQAVFGDIEDSLDATGKVVLIGMDALPAPMLLAKYQLLAGRIYGSIGHCGGPFGRTISLHAAGRIDMSKIVTSEFRMDDALAAVAQAANRTDAKILLTP